ncbi:MAG: hypothetical protein JWM74_1122 [Myxococcaceae bacterium]|nr:hypothetical protein [Myxococcaceae bacterium]
MGRIELRDLRGHGQGDVVKNAQSRWISRAHDAQGLVPLFSTTRMDYRTNGSEASPRFTERQLTWIRACSSEVEVAANLRGQSLAEPPSIAPDEVRGALFWIGVPFVALGAFAFYATGSGLALLPGGLGVLLLAGALVRSVLHEKKRRVRPDIDVVTLSPIFDERIVEDEEGAQRTMMFVKAREAALGSTEMVWPSKLHKLTAELGESEKLRVGILCRGTTRYIAWAHPL